jgi:hypothetical protein
VHSALAPGGTMTVYKPSFSSALETIGLRLKGSLLSEGLAPANSGNRVLSESVRAPAAYPATRRAGMDGTTVAGWFAGSAVLTGEPVDPTVEWIVMEEEGRAVSADAREAPEVTHVKEVASEYRRGDLMACAGQAVTHGLVSQALVVGIDEWKVFERPRVRVVVVGEEGESGAVLHWLTGSLSERFPFQVDGTTVASVQELPSVLVGESHLLVVASDGAPGRYREMRAFCNDPPPWFRPDFWKVDAHPCRHMGFGRLGAVPTLILPDVFYKTMLLAALMVPYAATALFAAADPVLPPVPLSLSVPLPGPFPFVLPVARPEPGDSRWQPLATDNMFSGRGTVELDGLAVWQRAGELPQLLTFGFSGT